MKPIHTLHVCSLHVNSMHAEGLERENSKKIEGKLVHWFKGYEFLKFKNKSV